MFVGGSPLVGVDISGTNWCWHANTNLELDLSFTDGINTWHAHIYLVMGFTLHTHNVFFSHNLGSSIVKLSTDHVFSTITFVCLVLYISLVSMLANLLQCTYIHCIYLRYMYLYNRHSLPSLHSCNQQCPLVWPQALVLSLAWGGISMFFIFGSCLWLGPVTLKADTEQLVFSYFQFQCYIFWAIM